MFDLHVSIPLLSPLIGFFLFLFLIYLIYLFITRAFREMGFSPLEALFIVFVALLFQSANIYLFSYKNWLVSLNVGGGLIPILLSIYLCIKKGLSAWKILLGAIIVAFSAYSVTYPEPNKGIVSPFPFFLIPAFLASVYSIFSYWNDRSRAGPLAYVSGTFGVLIGADLFHLSELMSYHVSKPRCAVIGGAAIFDMVFITGLIAVFIDSILLFGKKRET
ncbi:MAG: DUF1614 domain-containing protein [Thermoplasmata archaeon]|nr:DUF1614 domain-containing protein [Thermoplasmata archaeon]